MNIQEAKEQIEKAVKIYLAKDEYGNYRIPVEWQRPVFVLGAPGIGKTAIMEQIAEEMGIALVSYSMKHHTRQSALGLPFISHKNYQGTEFDVSEYTMSEIIASVYEMMEKTGKKEGILFLDEINCMSEMLAPLMLQFLQFKMFGKHSVPEGWVVATAGNPPQFDRSVREFDVVTMDRLKVLEVEPDYPTWRHYAVNRGIHGSILTYLDIKKEDFYVIENTVDGKSYVTARGWEDLSEAIYLYEEDALRKLLLTLKELRDTLGEMEQLSQQEILDVMRADWESLERMIWQEDAAKSLSPVEKKEYQLVIETLKENARAIRMEDLTCAEDAFALVKKHFEQEVSRMKAEQREISKELSHLFHFVEENLGAGNEMLVLVTDLTVNRDSAKFISRCGCEEYEKYNKEFQIYERQWEIADEVEKLCL